MGKSSKPNYSGGSVTINGRTVVTSKKDGDYIDSQYNMSKSEKALYDNIQKNLNSSVKNLFNISNSTKKAWQNELKAYKQKGIDQIENIYTPMETDLKNDIASRFGNLDNSIFMDNLSKITDNKAKAVASLSNELLTKQDELYTQEMKNRINYINLLNGINNSMTNNMLNFMQMAQSNSESGNNYNNRVNQNQGNLFSSIFGTGMSFLN
ncbi:hypothetical protein IJ541_01430 [bacterium]|nr:hypothetical protein [bacterium]